MSWDAEAPATSALFMGGALPNPTVGVVAEDADLDKPPELLEIPPVVLVPDPLTEPAVDGLGDDPTIPFEALEDDPETADRVPIVPTGVAYPRTPFVELEVPETALPVG